MRSLRILACIGLVLSAVMIAQTKANYVYVANYSSNTVSVINITNNQVVKTIAVGTNPFAVAVDQAGKFAYVTNYDSSSVSVISTSTNAVLATIAVGSKPDGIVLAQSGKTAYVANQASNSVSIINTGTRKVTATVTVQSVPEGLAILSNGTFVYAANFGSNSVSVISTLTNSVVANISVGTGPIAIATSPDGSTAFVTNYNSSTVSVIRTADNSVVNTINVSSGPYGDSVSPDGHWLYVASSNVVSVVDTSTQTVTATIATGGGEHTFPAFTQDSAFAYVSNPGSTTVTVINTATQTVSYTIAVGSEPVGVAVMGTMKVSTVAGGYLGDNGPATSAAVSFPYSTVQDKKGNYYVTDREVHRIRRITPTGTITTVAGTGICGYNGDHIKATQATLCYPSGLAFDSTGNLYVADSNNQRVRRIDTKGMITTVAGTGVYGYSGDGGPATSAALGNPWLIAFDAGGNLYFSEIGNNIVRKVSTSGIISTYAGIGVAGFSGDGGPATAATMSSPVGIAFDESGNLYIADNANRRIRIVTAAGTINTFAGNGQGGCGGDGGLATAANMGAVNGISIHNGVLYVTAGCNRVRAVDLTSNIVSTIAGSSTGYDGDNNPPLSSRFSGLRGILVDAAGNLLIDDAGGGRVRKLSGGLINTFAGGYLGDGNPATSAALVQPEALAIDKSGNLYIADSAGNRVRKVSNGKISTIAGSSVNDYWGDGGPATSALLNAPQGVAVDSFGNVFIADTYNGVIRKVDTTGTISTFAADPNFCDLLQMATDSRNNLYVADDCSSVIFKVTPAGVVSVFAGVPFNYGYNGDNIPATTAWLNSPVGVAVDTHGNVLIADTYNSRVRQVHTAANGAAFISTITGDGNCNYTGDGGSAAAAELCYPWSAAVSSSGTIYIVDKGYLRIREISGGMITAFAGSETFFNGDDLWPLLTAFTDPVGVAVDSKGAVYVLDDYDKRVRKIQ